MEKKLPIEVQMEASNARLANLPPGLVPGKAVVVSHVQGRVDLLLLLGDLLSRDVEPAAPVHVVNLSLELGGGGEGWGLPAEDLSLLHNFLPDEFFSQSQTFLHQHFLDGFVMDFGGEKVHLLHFQGDVADPGVVVLILSDDLK